MTLPISGPISIGGTGSSDITTEFGLDPRSPFPSSFYGLGGAPSSGPLSFSDFYGRSRNKIEASKTSMAISGYTQADSSTITVTGGTIASYTLISGIESARVGKSGIGSSTGYLTVTTPSTGNGNINNTYRVTDSNGNYVDVSVMADWGSA